MAGELRKRALQAARLAYAKAGITGVSQDWQDALNAAREVLTAGIPPNGDKGLEELARNIAEEAVERELFGP